jgi:hypothetical protein
MQQEMSSQPVQEDAHPSSFAASHWTQYRLVTTRVFQQYVFKYSIGASTLTVCPQILAYSQLHLQQAGAFHDHCCVHRLLFLES